MLLVLSHHSCHITWTSVTIFYSRPVHLNISVYEHIPRYIKAHCKLVVPTELWNCTVIQLYSYKIITSIHEHHNSLEIVFVLLKMCNIWPSTMKKKKGENVFVKDVSYCIILARQDEEKNLGEKNFFSLRAVCSWSIYQCQRPTTASATSRALLARSTLLCCLGNRL